MLLPLLSEAQAAGITIEVEVIDIVEEGLIDAYGVRIPVLRSLSTGEELDWPFGLGCIRDLFLYS